MKITEEEFLLAHRIIIFESSSEIVEKNTHLADKLVEALRDVGISVHSNGYGQWHPDNKRMFFSIICSKLDAIFISKDHSQNWVTHKSLNELCNFPGKSYKSPVQETIEKLRWREAYTLAYSMGADIRHVTDQLLLLKGYVFGGKFGI